MTNTSPSDGDTRRRDRALKRIEFLILAVVQTGPLHGYGIVQEISRRTNGGVEVRPGSLYRVLDRLMHRGFLELADSHHPSDDRRTDYQITKAGEVAVQAEAQLLAGVAGPILASGRGNA